MLLRRCPEDQDRKLPCQRHLFAWDSWFEIQYLAVDIGIFFRYDPQALLITLKGLKELTIVTHEVMVGILITT
jgi:hypothetical protein